MTRFKAFCSPGVEMFLGGSSQCGEQSSHTANRCKQPCLHSKTKLCRARSLYLTVA